MPLLHLLEMKEDNITFLWRILLNSGLGIEEIRKIEAKCSIKNLNDTQKELEELQKKSLSQFLEEYKKTLRKRYQNFIHYCEKEKHDYNRLKECLQYCETLSLPKEIEFIKSDAISLIKEKLSIYDLSESEKDLEELSQNLERFSQKLKGDFLKEIEKLKEEEIKRIEKKIKDYEYIMKEQEKSLQKFEIQRKAFKETFGDYPHIW